MRVGIQGGMGSACSAALPGLFTASDRIIDLDSLHICYLHDAEKVLNALSAGTVDLAVIALESPKGVAIPETEQALLRYRCRIVQRYESDVPHRLLVRCDHTGARRKMRLLPHFLRPGVREHAKKTKKSIKSAGTLNIPVVQSLGLNFFV